MAQEQVVEEMDDEQAAMEAKARAMLDNPMVPEAMKAQVRDMLAQTLRTVATNAAQCLGAGATSSTATDGCLIQKPTPVLLSPMQLSCLRDCPPIRALLLGTTDPGSVLYRLPKSDGVLNIILRFVVLYCQGEVPVRTCVG